MEEKMNIFEQRESEVRSYCRSFPTMFSKAKNSTLYSVDGTEYLDFFAGAGALNYGHNNDYIKERIIEYVASDGVMHSLDMFAVAKEAFLETFSKKILEPRNMPHKVMFSGPTGTNAIEAAMKIVRKATGRKNIFAFTGSFHGMTAGALSITSGTPFQSSLQNNGTNVAFMPFPYGFNTSFDTIEYIKNILDDEHSGLEKPAAIFLEVLQSEGGIRPVPMDWLKRLRQLCTDYDILLVIDDIQIGNGRSGKFFSFEWAEIQPDLITLSKSISGYGLPMALVLIKPEYDVFYPAEHNGTFRGVQLSMVGAKAALEYREMVDLDQQVVKKAEMMDNYIKENILPLSDKFDTRGLGLLRGIDCHDGAFSKKVTTECFNNNLIMERAGNNDEVLKLMPPLIITEDEMFRGLEILKNAIKKSL